MKLISHIGAWNRWRKNSLDSKMYKISVLFGMPSPTFILSKFKINK